MGGRNERMPLLLHRWTEEGDIRTLIRIEDLPDEDNPRAWKQDTKVANVAVVAIMACLSSLVAGMFTLYNQQMAEDLSTMPLSVSSATTNFLVMMGVGPLVLAPLSETFGRRHLYLVCFSCFSLLQIVTAFAPNVTCFIITRTLSGFFGSIGIASGGGTVCDMFLANERAEVYGWYLTGPLIGFTLGPLFGGIVAPILDWRVVFCAIAIVCCITTWVGFFVLQETYAPAILEQLKTDLEQEAAEFDGAKYGYEGEDIRPMAWKIGHALMRPLRILSQPIFAAMTLYQAVILAITFSISANIQDIFSKTYNFEEEQGGMLYLGLGFGFLLTTWILVPGIDDVYKVLTAENHGVSIPEYRLPLANIGAILVSTSLFWLAWAVQTRMHWFPTIASTFSYGTGLVTILNCMHNYYIDSFGGYAASAIAAGTAFGSLLGGIISLGAPGLFDIWGFGWGISVLSCVSIVLAPAPLLLYCFGKSIRERCMVRV